MSRGYAATFVAGLAFVALGGCGGKPSSGVRGKVTLDGRPVAAGLIKFQPEPNTDSTNAVVPIANGDYDAVGKGLRPGAFRVEISAMKKTGKKVTIRSTSPMGGSPKEVDEEVESLPPRYNRNTELRYEVLAGNQEKNFELVTK